MTITALRPNSTFDGSFFNGVGSSSLVPSVYPVAIDGRPYQIIWDKDAIEVWGAKYKTNAQPLLRAQADQSNTPGEQSISPENFWRRSQENWVSGSGQSQQDRKGSTDTRFNSVESRFSTSKGINPWTPYQLSLLNDTTQKRASANTNLQVIVCGANVYLNDGGTLYQSTNLTSWTAVTGLTGTVNSICSDGTNLYVATASALYYVPSSAPTVATSHLAATVFSLIAYTKGRLMAVSGNAIYNILGVLGSGALGTALMTKLSGYNFVGFAGGQSQIYAAGYSGTQSSIWRISILADGTALTGPINAGDLPLGEIVRSIFAYQQYVVIGSDLGVRFCSVASDGSLNIGALIPTTSPVYCFEGQDHFIWYGLTNFDSISSGLGRMDLNTFLPNASLAPAYASDLMAGVAGAVVQGAVKSVQSFANYRIFTIDGKGLYAETLNTPVATGTFFSGAISYNLIDTKVALFLDIAHLPLNGTISAAFAADNSGFAAVGTSSTPNSTSPGYSFQVGQKPGFQFQIQITLTPSNNVSPILTRWTLRSYPTPTRSNQFLVPIALFPTVDVKGQTKNVNVPYELKHLRALLSSQQVVSYQEGNDVFQVIMYDYQWLPKAVDPLTGYMYGIFFATLNQVTS